MDGVIKIGDIHVGKFEAITDLENVLPSITVIEAATVVLFMVDLAAPMSLAGTISGMEMK